MKRRFRERLHLPTKGFARTFGPPKYHGLSNYPLADYPHPQVNLTGAKNRLGGGGVVSSGVVRHTDIP